MAEGRNSALPFLGRTGIHPRFRGNEGEWGGEGDKAVSEGVHDNGERERDYATCAGSIAFVLTAY